MAHTNKRKKEIKKNRGATFIGFAPKVEETKKGRILKAEKKHKTNYKNYCW